MVGLLVREKVVGVGVPFLLLVPHAVGVGGLFAKFSTWEERDTLNLCDEACPF